MANYPVLRCRFCGKESSRPGWITNAHEPVCAANPNRRPEGAPDALTVGMTNGPVNTPPPSNETPEQELERLRRRCLDYESTQRSLSKEVERINAELERTRRELNGRKGCVLCNTELLPDSVRATIAAEVVKTVSAKHDVMQKLLSSVILPNQKAAE